MSDQDIVVLVQTLLHYFGPAGAPDSAKVEETVQRFRKMSTDYSVAHSPKEDALKL